MKTPHDKDTRVTVGQDHNGNWWVLWDDDPSFDPNLIGCFRNDRTYNGCRNLNIYGPYDTRPEEANFGSRARYVG